MRETNIYAPRFNSSRVIVRVSRALELQHVRNAHHVFHVRDVWRTERRSMNGVFADVRVCARSRQRSDVYGRQRAHTVRARQGISAQNV
jgi:hypothetical protein